MFRKNISSAIGIVGARYLTMTANDASEQAARDIQSAPCTGDEIDRIAETYSIEPDLKMPLKAVWVIDVFRRPVQVCLTVTPEPLTPSTRLPPSPAQQMPHVADKFDGVYVRR